MLPVPCGEGNMCKVFYESSDAKWIFRNIPSNYSNPRKAGVGNRTKPPPHIRWLHLLVMPCRYFAPRWSVWSTRMASPSSRTAWWIVRSCRLLILLSIRLTTSMSTRSHRPLLKSPPSAPGLAWKPSPVSRSTWPHNPTSEARLCASCCPPISTTRRTSSRRTLISITTASLWVTKHYLAWVNQDKKFSVFNFRLQ